MNRITYHTRLLSSAALGLGLAFAASPAQAACTVGPLTVDCAANTTTTDTVVPTNLGADRGYDALLAPGTVTATVQPGVTVDGFGLAFYGGTGDINATNNGVIQIDSGNTATAGGSGSAFYLSTSDGTITYTGTGDIFNLGTAGNGLEFNITGTGAVNATVGGDVTAGPGFNWGIVANINGAGGNSSITTLAGTTVLSDYDAVALYNNNAASTNNIAVTNNATIGSMSAPGTIQYGVSGVQSGLGNDIITNNGALGSATDRIQTWGIEALLQNALSSGTLTVNGTGAIWGAGTGIEVQNSGTGATSVNYTGAIDTTGGPGIFASATSGSLTMTSGAITTTGGDAIDASSTTGNQLITLGGVVNASGNGVNATSTSGNVNVHSNPGATITSAGTSVLASTGGAGTMDVSISAAVNSTGGDAINTTAATGATTISTGAVITGANNGLSTTATTGVTVINVLSGSITGTAADGIHAQSTTGGITVNVSGGNVVGTDDGIEMNSTGAKIVNISAGRSVTGAFGVYGNGAGTLVVNNSGTLGIAGQIAVLASFTTPTTVNNLTGATMNGAVDLSNGNDSVVNTGTWNSTGVAAFYTGTDVITNNAGGIINFATGSSFLGLESLTNAGTINVAGTLAAGGSTLSGAGTLNLLTGAAVTGLGATTLGATNAAAGTSIAGTGAFINGGILNTAGAFTIAGFTTMSNTGTIDLAPGAFTVPAVAFANSGTIIADEGASSITGQTAFNNSGTIRLNDGATGDVLTINSGFVGSGASNLNVDVSSTAADMLVITGAASGTSIINVQPTGAVVVNSTGILVVDAGTSTAGAFTLGNTIGTALIDFTLERIGEDFFLFAAPNANAFDPLALINIGTDMWYQSADIYDNYAALKRSDLTPGARPLGFWGQVYLSRDRYGDSDTQSVFGSDVTINEHVRTNRRGIQGGVDYNFGGGVIGITGGWQRAKANLGGSVAEVKGTGWNAGGYAIFGSATGFYGGLLVKYDRNRLRVDNPAFVGLNKLNSRSWGAEGEVGYRLPMGSSTLDLGGGLAWVNTKHEDFTFGGIGYDFDRSKSLRGRLGARYETAMGVFVDAKVLHEFRKHNDLTLVSGAESDTIEAEGRGTWFRGEIGYGKPASSGPIAALWGELGDVKGFGGKLGFRFGGARVVEAPLPPPPPPPPPPPAPPPATQTCPDGSVILATDACPVPPPPPPPPPPAPERGR